MKNRSFGLTALFTILIAFIFTASTVSVPEYESGTVCDSTLLKAYQSAIRDAEIAEPNEISRELIAIVESNKQLVWRGNPGNREVLVVTWTESEKFDELAGKEYSTGKNIWVTVVPELKNFIEGSIIAQCKLDLRIEQLLGLPPGCGYTRMVEMWVNPSDLFRPSPDPEITDHECELTFPDSKYIVISAAHKKWFNELKSSSYGRDGYPWTRLGYTYDWGNPENEIGLSEFIISEGSTVKVKSVTKTADYFTSE